jgi:CDP-6-deoxy-D-xylo-4-hexulose-3-dehydrase
LEQYETDTRPLFVGDLTRPPDFQERHYRSSGELKNTDVIMNNTSWMRVYPARRNNARLRDGENGNLLGVIF